MAPLGMVAPSAPRAQGRPGGPPILGETERKRQRKCRRRRKTCPVAALGSHVPGAQDAPPASVRCVSSPGGSPRHVLLLSSENPAEHRILALTAEGQRCPRSPFGARPGPRPRRAADGPSPAPAPALRVWASSALARGSSASGSGSPALRGRKLALSGFLGETPGSLKYWSRSCWGLCCELAAGRSADLHPPSRREGGRAGRGEGPLLTTHRPSLNRLFMLPSERRDHIYLAGGCQTRNPSEAPITYQALRKGPPASPLHKDQVLPLPRPCPPLPSRPCSLSRKAFFLPPAPGALRAGRWPLLNPR